MTDPVTNIFEVVGTQRNNGAELFFRVRFTGPVDPLVACGYIDARLDNTGVATTNGRLVVGVPLFKTDVALDYHPAVWMGLCADRRCSRRGRAEPTSNINNNFAQCTRHFDAGVRYSTTVDKKHHHGAFEGAECRQCVLLFVDRRRQRRGKSSRQHRLPPEPPRTFMLSLQR